MYSFLEGRVWDSRPPRPHPCGIFGARVLKMLCSLTTCFTWRGAAPVAPINHLGNHNINRSVGLVGLLLSRADCVCVCVLSQPPPTHTPPFRTHQSILGVIEMSAPYLLESLSIFIILRSWGGYQKMHKDVTLSHARHPSPTLPFTKP